MQLPIRLLGFLHKRLKLVRYECKHSMSAEHINWHEWEGTRAKVRAILDDASGMIQAGGELTKFNTDNRMLIIDQLVDGFWWLNPTMELIFEFPKPGGLEKAFRRKMPLEAYFSIGHRSLGL